VEVLGPFPVGARIEVREDPSGGPAEVHALRR